MVATKKLLLPRVKWGCNIWILLPHFLTSATFSYAFSWLIERIGCHEWRFLKLVQGWKQKALRINKSTREMAAPEGEDENEKHMMPTKPSLSSYPIVLQFGSTIPMYSDKLLICASCTPSMLVKNIV